MLRPKAVPTIETAAGFPIDVEIVPSATGQISRDGLSVEQRVERPTTVQLVVGATILLLTDNQQYKIVLADQQQFSILRLADGTTHVATLKQLKQYAYLITERLEGTG